MKEKKRVKKKGRGKGTNFPFQRLKRGKSYPQQSGRGPGGRGVGGGNRGLYREGLKTGSILKLKSYGGAIATKKDRNASTGVLPLI